MRVEIQHFAIRRETDTCPLCQEVVKHDNRDVCIYVYIYIYIYICMYSTPMANARISSLFSVNTDSSSSAGCSIMTRLRSTGPADLEKAEVEVKSITSVSSVRVAEKRLAEPVEKPTSRFMGAMFPHMFEADLLNF